MPCFNVWNINNQSKRKYTCKDSLANSSIKFNMITPPSEITHQCIVYEKRILMLHVVLLNKALFVDKCIHVLDDMRERPLSARNAGNSSFPKVDCILTLSEIHIWFLLILITHGQSIKLSALTYKFCRLVIANQSNTANQANEPCILIILRRYFGQFWIWFWNSYE